MASGSWPSGEAGGSSAPAGGRSVEFVEVGEVQLAVEQAGDGDPPFLFVHGWASDRSVWSLQASNLTVDHRCISVDLRGCGESPEALPCDVQTAADDLAVVLKELSPGPVIVAGHGLGGVVALHLNYRHPELVLGAVLGDSAIGNAEDGTATAQAELAREIESTASLEQAGPLIDRFFAADTPTNVEAAVRELVAGCPPSIAAGMLAEPDTAAQLDELIKAADNKPFMVFWSERPRGDPVRLREVAIFLRQEPIAASGHFFQLEQPDITNALLRAFLDDVAHDPRVPMGEQE